MATDRAPAFKVIVLNLSAGSGVLVSNFHYYFEFFGPCSSSWTSAHTDFWRCAPGRGMPAPGFTLSKRRKASASDDGVWCPATMD